MYKQFIGLPAVYAACNTNIKEAVEFAANAFDIRYFLTSLAITTPLLYCLTNPLDLPQHEPKSLPFLKIFPILTAVIVLGKYFMSKDGLFWTRNNPFFDIPKNVYAAVKEKRELNGIYAKMTHHVASGVIGRSEKSTHILILGESINRNHMSLYGYSRNTTPLLQHIADKLFVLKDPCSSRNTTIPSLKELFTFATRENDSPLMTEPNLIQIMHEAGFKTFWLSNQQEVGEQESYISVFSNCSNYREFVDRRGWADGMSLDEKLFEPFRRALAEKAPKKFIVVHLIGAHHLYCLRYPEKFNVFNNLTGLHGDSRKMSPSALRKYNEYDNAIFYHDYVVHQLINMTSPSERVTVTYLSDHSESVGDGNEFFGHAENLPYRSINEIPLFFYFSPDFQKAKKSEISILKRNLSKPFQSDQMIHSLLDIYDIQYTSIRYNQSLFKSDFTPTHRYCDDITYKGAPPSRPKP